ILKANTAADIAIRSGTNTAAASFKLGCLLHNLNRHRDALGFFEESLRRNPNFFEALIQHGLSCLALDKPAVAFASFSKAAAIRPGEMEVRNNLWAALISLGKLREAVAICDAVLADDPANLLAALNSGIAYERLRQTREALASFERALRIDPTNVA